MAQTSILMIIETALPVKVYTIMRTSLTSFEKWETLHTPISNTVTIQIDLLTWVRSYLVAGFRDGEFLHNPSGRCGH